MRTSKKELILRTAISYIGEHSLEALSYDTLAEATGLSKSGLIYHFPSRHALLLGMHELLADDWDQQLRAIARDPEDPLERLRAVVVTLTENVSRPELLLLIDAPSHPDFLHAWRTVNHKWIPDTEDLENNAHKQAVYLVQLAADGLFVHDYIHDDVLSAPQRQAMLKTILQLIPNQE
ncbi:TetR/AcrR family transcriptional regulator [Corynebacterium crudilactis]|uniref:TetR family transcriptional regulator n=1 Tax=Corynebacterium crudilactis TaxID=1652495 RepID=A0A172QVP9_9CORY|nr:TetR family transcriptional regulator [Corynebacterium crudilactis]ANE04803.1 TetR family transcriptional regulator [Corynebacterium crudilactis]